MVYTEVKTRAKKKYYYRVRSVKIKGKTSKERVYLGVNLNKKDLSKKIKEADIKLNIFEHYLSREEIKSLDKIKKSFIKEPSITLNNRYEAFSALFTYNSTAIEGNTLTLQETTRLLFHNISPTGRSLREVNEVLNHKRAFDYILHYKGDINKRFILDLHRFVVSNTLEQYLKSQIGVFRKVQVFISGVEWKPPKPHDVPPKIASLLRWYTKNKHKLHPLVLASYFHSEFEKIHPFVDGNGRVGRLLLNYILHKNKYPMINIPNNLKHRYYDTLAKSQTKNNIKPFIKLLLELLEENEIRL